MKTRDADRSREAILGAAEDLFSRRGFHGCSLADIGTSAGLSRATPTYFFGSKEKLYRAVLERAFEARQSETQKAVEPILAWCAADPAEPGLLEAALAGGMDLYMKFLLDRPSFGRLVYWEELDGASRLGATERRSTALTDAFVAVRGTQAKPSFEVRDAVVLWVSLGFLPATLPTTFMAGQGIDLKNGADRRRHAELSAAQMMALILPER